MSFVWLEYYGRTLGLNRRERRATIFGELCDLIACYQIERYGLKEKLPDDDDDGIPDIP